MPVILDPPDYDKWLDVKNEDVEYVAYMLDQLPVERMSVRPVSTYVNNVRNQGVECVRGRGRVTRSFDVSTTRLVATSAVAASVSA